MGRGAAEDLLKSQGRAELPLSMISLVKVLPLSLHLTSANKSISALLAHKAERVEHLIHLSR